VIKLILCIYWFYYRKYLSTRLASHKIDYKKYLNGARNHITSFEITKFNDVNIILLKDFPCQRIDQLHAGGRYWIEMNDNCLNKIFLVVLLNGMMLMR